MIIDSNCIIISAFVLILAYSICSLVWLLGLKNAVIRALDKMDMVLEGMKNFCESEGVKEYAKRLKEMTDEELEREISNGRLVSGWGKEIATTVEGLRSSVPFLGRR